MEAFEGKQASCILHRTSCIRIEFCKMYEKWRVSKCTHSTECSKITFEGSAPLIPKIIMGHDP